MSEPIRYIERTRRYYEAQGFARPYEWAHFEDIPFLVPSKPVRESVVAIVTTAISGPDVRQPMVARTARSIPIEQAPEAFLTADLSWDKVTTHTDDRESFFPLAFLQALAGQGRIGRVARRFHFVPTEYSQRHTLQDDAPQILAACIEDEVDIAILVPL